MRLLLVVSALLASCAGGGLNGIPTRHYFPAGSPGPMYSPCGVTYEYDTEALKPSQYAPPPPWHEWTVQDVREAEERMVHVLGSVPGFRSEQHVCASVRRLTIVFASAPVWEDQWGRHIAGFSACWGLEPTSVIGLGLEGGMVSTISNPHWGETGWRSTSFAHEVAHQMQNCQSNPDGLGVDPGFDSTHANWGRSGIAEALKGFYAP